MADGTLRTSHGGQDGITPDQHGILGQAGPDGFYLACGFSGTGFKTAPAIGRCLTELILDGRADDRRHLGLWARAVCCGAAARRRASIPHAVALMDTSQAARAARWARVEGTFAREDDYGIALILILLTILFFAAAEGADRTDHQRRHLERHAVVRAPYRGRADGGSSGSSRSSSSSRSPARS